jgi:dimethylamine/trimethylamine dehydrogenase
MVATDEYLDTLLTYYEEEVMGEAYFYGLVDHFDEQEKLVLMARVERCAADAVVPLLEKYDLVPRVEADLETLGKDWVERHESFKWEELMAYIIDRYPGYLDDFAALERMAPEEDLEALNILTAHEVAAIEFAERELAGDPHSPAPLYHYLEQ